jgi:hypothetical protein
MPILTLRRSLALLLVSAACATGGGTAATGAPSDGPSTSSPSNRALITEAEIPTTGTETAFDLIRRLRPEYLRVKPTQTYTGARTPEAPPPTVIQNGQRFGNPDDLKSISASLLSMVRYYNIEEGKRKFGMQYGGGVIEIAYRTR